MHRSLCRFSPSSNAGSAHASIVMIAMIFILATATVAAEEKTPRPNILWLLIEDSSPNFVGPYGDPLARTPTADRLAKDGIVFDRCYTAPVCAPSRNSLATGRYASSMGTQHMRSTRPLPAGVKMFTQYLREAGYYCTNNFKTDYNTSSDWSAAFDEVSTKADWRGRKPGQPFFAIFTFMQSHEEFLQTRQPLKTDPAKVRVPGYLPDTAVVRADVAQYYDLVESADAAAGAVLAQLEADGLLEDTIVFYAADNGGVVAGSKRFLNENGTRVPLIVRLPKKFAHHAPAATDGRNGELVHFVDFGPTVFSLLGIEPPAQFQGRAFAGPARAPAPEFAFMFRDRMDERYDMIRAVSDGRYRYIRNYYPDRPLGQRIDFLWKQASMQEWETHYRSGNLNAEQRRFFESKPVEELYDLEQDPDNIHNLAADPAHAERLARLRAALHAHQLAIRDTGFMPEPMMVAQAGSGSPAVVAADDSRYPLARLISLVDRLQLDAGPEALAHRAEAARDPLPIVRYWAAVVALDRLDTPAADIAPLLQDANATVRVAAAEAILRRGSDPAAMQVIEDAIVQTDQRELRLFALNALDRSGQPTPKILRSLLGQLAASDDFASFDYYLARAARPLLNR
ncbi:MAG: sulfatase-like hydrolase/transferase [Verrucomicrobiota bacterium]